MKYDCWLVRAFNGKFTEVWANGMYHVSSAEWPEILEYICSRLHPEDDVRIETDTGKFMVKGKRFIKLLRISK